MDFCDNSGIDFVFGLRNTRRLYSSRNSSAMLAGDKSAHTAFNAIAVRSGPDQQLGWSCAYHRDIGICSN
jgi:hypothetical protein